MELEIQPLTPDRLRDLAALSGQGGDPKWCWCAYFRLRQVDFSTATAESNRAILEQAMETTGAEGRTPGLVAYRGVPSTSTPPNVSPSPRRAALPPSFERGSDGPLESVAPPRPLANARGARI